MFTHNNTAGSLLVRCKPVATPNDLVAAAGSRQCPPLNVHIRHTIDECYTTETKPTDNTNHTEGT